MTKSLVVNGLTRSGTTMVERLMGAQTGFLSIDGLFELGKIYASLMGLASKGDVATMDLTTRDRQLSLYSADQLRVPLMVSYFTTVCAPLAYGYKSADHDSGEIVYGLTSEQIFQVAKEIRDFSSPWQIGPLMQKMGGSVGKEVIAAKWTQCHRCAPVFLDAPDTYWIEVIRNPYARTSSALRRKLAEFDHVALPITQDALRFASSFEHERYYLLRYEDLCADPDSVLAALSEWLGADVRNRPLKNAFGGDYRANTSANVEAGRPYWHEDENIAPRVGALADDRWRDALSAEDKELINAALDFCGLYPKELGSPAQQRQGRLRYRKIVAYGRIRKIVGAALARAGFEIKRVPSPPLFGGLQTDPDVKQPKAEGAPH